MHERRLEKWGARVSRKDETHGSNFVQEVKPGLYPVISEAIGIEHKQVGRAPSTTDVMIQRVAPASAGACQEREGRPVI